MKRTIPAIITAIILILAITYALAITTPEFSGQDFSYVFRATADSESSRTTLLNAGLKSVRAPQALWFCDMDASQTQAETAYNGTNAMLDCFGNLFAYDNSFDESSDVYSRVARNWKYYASSSKTLLGKNSNNLRMQPLGVNVKAQGSAKQWVAFVVNVPESGRYVLSIVTAGLTKGVPQGDVYWFPKADMPDAVSLVNGDDNAALREGVSAKLTPENLKGTFTSKSDKDATFKNPQLIENCLSAVDVHESGEYIVVITFKNNEYLYLSELRLYGRNILDSIESTLSGDLSIGATEKLDVSGKMLDGTEADLSRAVITYDVADESIAQTDFLGNITGISEGKTTVTTRVTLGNITKETVCQISVYDESDLTAVSLSGASELGVGKPMQYEVSGTMGSGRAACISHATVRWILEDVSPDGSISIRESGVGIAELTGNTVGATAKLSAEVTLRGISLTTEKKDIIVVGRALSSAELQLKKSVLTLGSQIYAKTLCLMSDGDVADESAVTLSYESSDETVLTVDPISGELTAQGLGTANITVTAELDGVTQTDTKTIKVIDEYIMSGVRTELPLSCTGYEELGTNQYLTTIYDVITQYSESRAWRLSDFTGGGNGMRCMSYGLYTSGGTYALRIKAPAAGVYNVYLNIKRSQSGGRGDVFLLPGDISDSEAIEKAAEVASGVHIDFEDAQMADAGSSPLYKIDIGNITAEADKEFIIVVKTVARGTKGSGIYINGITIDGRELPDSISLSTSRDNISVGENEAVKLEAFMSDGRAFDTAGIDVTYASDNTEVAEIEYGTIHAKREGKAKITAVISAGGLVLSADKEITVFDTEPIDSVNIGNDLTLHIGESYTLPITVKKRENVYEADGTAYLLSGNAVIVSGKTVTASRVGESTVSASVDGVSSNTVKITVTDNAKIELDGCINGKIPVFSKRKVSVTSFRGEVTDVSYTMLTDNAEISEDGVLFTKECGNASFRVKLMYAGGESEEQTVSVNIVNTGDNALLSFFGAELTHKLNGADSPWDYVYFTEEDNVISARINSGAALEKATLELKNPTADGVKVSSGGLYELCFEAKSTAKAIKLNAGTKTYGGTGEQTENLTLNSIECTDEFKEFRIPVTLDEQGGIYYKAPVFEFVPTSETYEMGEISIKNVCLREVGFAEVKAVCDENSITVSAYATSGSIINISDGGHALISSSDEDIVTVGTPRASDGKIHSVLTRIGKNGDARLACDITVAGITQRTECAYTVSGLETKFFKAHIEAEKSSLEVGENTKVLLTGEMTDGQAADLSDAVVSYYSRNLSVADVNKDGQITAVGEGEANIIADVTLGGVTKRAYANVVVKDNSGIKSVSLVLPETVEKGSAAESELKILMNSGACMPISYCDVEYELVSETAMGSVILGANAIIGNIENSNATIRARVTLRGETKYSNEAIIRVTEEAPDVVIIDFKGNAPANSARNASLYVEGFAINASASTEEEILYHAGGIEVSTKTVGTTKNSDVAIEFNIPENGIYDIEFEGANIFRGAALSYVYIDGMFVGEYDFYGNSSMRRNQKNVADTKKMRTLELTSGTHTLTIRAIEANPQGYCRVVPGCIRFIEREDAPSITSVHADTGRNELIVGESVSFDLSYTMDNALTVSAQNSLQNSKDQYVKVHYAALTANLSVTDDGVVTALSEGLGKVAITASIYGNETETEVEFYISNRKIANAEILCDTLYVGGSVELKTKVTLDDGTEYTGALTSCEFKSMTENTATVSGDVAYGVSVGSARIICGVRVGTTFVQGELSAEVKPEEIAQLQLTADTAVLRPGSDPVMLSVKGITSLGNAASTDGLSISYESSDESVVSVSQSGMVTPHGVGSAVITAQTDSISGDMTFTVRTGKTSSTYYTKDKVENLRTNYQNDVAGVRSAVDSAIANAEKYIAIGDEKLWMGMPTEGLPRSSSLGFRGDPEEFTCKYCGTDIRSKYSWTKWVVRPLYREWKVQCPECKRVFPSNDFAGFYNLGFDENHNWSRELALERNNELIEKGEKGYLVNVLYPEAEELFGDANWGVDDGFGYRTGRVYQNGVPEVHTYIAHCNYVGLWLASDTSTHEGLYSSATESLTLAYLATGKAKYGRTLAIILDRFADLYPDFQTGKYGEYGTFQCSQMSGNCGKVVGSIADCRFISKFILAYDAVFDIFDDPYVTKFLSDKAKTYKFKNSKDTSEKIRDNIETGILRETYDGCRESDIWGNFGMHQTSLAQAALVLDTLPETEEWIDWLFREDTRGAGSGVATGGSIMTKIMTETSRDGHGPEGSVSYNATTLDYLVNFADIFDGYKSVPNADLYKNAKFISMAAACMDIRAGDGVANIGDSAGAMNSCKSTIDASELAKIYTKTKNPYFARAAYWANGNSTDGLVLGMFDSNPEGIGKLIEAEVRKYGKLDWGTSSCLTGLGFMALRDGERYDEKTDKRQDFWMYFGGATEGHKHSDVLNLGIDVGGLELMPELGYPLGSSYAESYAWTQNNISHNTVVIDNQRQAKNPLPGNPLHFNDSGDVKVMDADAQIAYPSSEIYRRTVVTIKTDENLSYGVDFFRVRGGSEHTYSIHAAANDVYDSKGFFAISQPTGSYAGADVPRGDDPTAKVRNSWDIVGNTYPIGYTYLDNVRKSESPNTGEIMIDYKIEDYRKYLPVPRNIHLRISTVNNFNFSEIALVHGYPPAKKENSKIPYFEYALMKRTGDNLDTLFTTVLQPYENKPYIESTSDVQMTLIDGKRDSLDTAKAIKVTRANGRTDYILYATNNELLYEVTDGNVSFRFRGFVGVYSVKDEKCIYKYLLDGDILGDMDKMREYTGTVKDFTKVGEEIGIEFDHVINVKFDTEVDINKLAGSLIIVENDGVENGAYTVKSAERIDEDTVALHIGNVSLARALRDNSDANAGYVYNIGEGDRFSIALAHVDSNAPIFKEITDKSVSANSLISVKMEAASPLGLSVTYKPDSLPSGALLDPQTGEFTWKPNDSQVGENYVGITAVDSEGRETTVRFVIKVLGATTGSVTSPQPTEPSGSGGGGSVTPTEPSDSGGSVTPIEPMGMFTDLTGYDWAQDAIETLARSGIIKGVSNNKFAPGKNISRCDFAILLVRAFKLESSNTENFADVSEGDYFSSELAIARNTGIVCGIGDNRYAPRQAITREDMMVIVYRALTKLGYSLSYREQIEGFDDISEISDYAREAVSMLIANNLISGDNGKINPKKATTRAEVAVLLKRILDIKK